MTRLPPQIAAQLAKLGAKFDADVLAATRSLFQPHQNLELSEPGRVIPNVAYGEAERHKLDLYVPGGEGRPVLVYVPGGGFVGGDRRGYRNIGCHFARAGFLTVIPDYRLAPSHTWPAGAQDVSAVIDFVSAQASKYGGDASRISVFAQSAGATHAAGALFDLNLQPKAIQAVRKAVLMNGIYRIDATEKAPNLLMYFGEDATQYRRRSPINHVANNRLPVLLVLTEFDPASLAAPTLELAYSLCLRDGKAPPLVWLRAHNHVSPVFAIGTPYDDLGSVVAEFMSAN